MRKRGARPLKELYDLTDTIGKPEITPVLEGSYRIQGPVDEPDHVLLRANSGMFPAEKRYTFVNENLHTRAESGTCNVCSAPCSSCMHLNRTASVMESNIACPFPGNTFGRKEADSCSFIAVDGYKSRTCDDNQHAASETSNLLGTSSSHDSYSENAESKATLRASVTYVASDAVDMLPKVSSSAEVGDDLLPKKNNVTAHSLVSSQSHITSVLGHKAFLSRDEEQRGSECHGDKISCITAVRDANAPVLDRNVDLDKKDAACSSASTSSFLAKEIEDVVLVEAACGFHDHEIEESQSNPRRPDTCHKESLRKKSTGSNPANAGVSDKPELADFPPSKNIPSPKVQSPCLRSQQGYSFQHNANSKDLEGNLSSHFQAGTFECSMENAESSLSGPLAAGSVNERKSAALPNHEDSKSSYIRSGNSSAALKDTDPCFETEISVDGSSDEVIKCSTITEQFENSNPFMEASKMQGPQVQPQLNVEGENSESDSGLDDVKVCDICGDAGREVLLAICSRCTDGAEHTYCMRKMLDKLPEGDWLCEECKAKEDTEIQKVDKSETASGTSKPTCLNEISQHFVSSFNPKLLPKLNTKTVDLVARAVIKGPQSPQISSTRHADNLVDSSVTSKKASEASGGSIGTSSPRKKTVLSRESSFKNLDMGKVKPVNMRSSFGGHSANNAPAFSRLQTSLGSNSFKLQTQLQSPRVPISRSNSLNNSNLKRSPKVKQIMENVPHKVKPTRESTSDDSRKEGFVRTLTKSTSFKSECLNRSNIESLDKTQSLNPSRGEDSSGFGSQSSNGVCNSVDQKPCQVPKDGVRASSTVTDRTCSRVDIVLPCGVTQAAESALRNDKTKESTIRDDKTKESTLFSSSKQVVSGGNRILRCQRCNAGHATQFCPIKKLSSPALKPSAERNLKEGFKKSNKWKVAVEAINSKTRVQKNNKLSDQSEEFQMPSANLSCGAASKDILSSTSSCQGDLPFLERTTDGQEITRGSDAEPSKTTVNDTRQQAMNPREASYVSTASDSNVILTISDVSNVKSSIQILPDQASILANSLRASAIPELESIWQGGFEVLRTGRLPGLFDGIQAHLSTCASPKVPEVVTKFPGKVQLEEVPRISSWPSQFQGTSPKEDNIALFFFAKDIESYEKNYIKLLENMLTNDLALRGNIDGVELLIFPSNRLPANSQCWNKLFFLWGVFRGRRTNCLEALPGSQKKPCWSISTDSLVQDLPSRLINDVSNSQKIDSCDVRDTELSWCDRSSKTKTVMSTTSANCWPISSSGVDDRTRNTEVSPLAGNCLYQVAADSKLPSECTLFPVSCSLKGMNQLPSLLTSFPESRLQLSSKISFREGNIDATYLNNSGGGGKIAGSPSHTDANNVQTSFRALPANTDSSNCREGAEGSRSEEKMRKKDKSMRSEDPRENPTEIDHLSWESKPNRKRALSSTEMVSVVRSEAALADSWENPTERGHLSWESRPSRKRARSLSSEMASLASSETSESTDETKLWKEKADNTYVEDGAEHKKYGEGHSSISFRDENLSGGRSSSKVHPFVGSFLNEQQYRGGVREETVMPESSIGAERCFFSVDLGPLRDTKLDNVIHVSSDAEDLPESNGPFLELALGSKKSGKQKELPLLVNLNGSQDRSSAACSAADEEQKSLPLFFPLDRNGGQDRLRGTAAGGDASLSLSLGFPSTHAKSILKTEQPMPDGPRVNTSLILFRGFPDT